MSSGKAREHRKDLRLSPVPTSKVMRSPESRHSRKRRHISENLLLEFGPVMTSVLFEIDIAALELYAERREEV